MGLNEIIGEYAGWLVAGVGILLSAVEVSKIKINPWSMLFGWIGDKLLAGVKGELSAMKNEVTEVRKEVGELRGEHRRDEAIAARTRILRFSDEIYQQARHSKEYFDQILMDISTYKKYCEQHREFKNEMTIIAVERIEEVYRRCMEQRDFL